MMTITLRFLALAILALLLPATHVHARGGGGCVEQGTPVLTPNGPVAIEKLQAGDNVLGVSSDRIAPVTVQSVMQVRPEEYYEIVANGRVLRVTADHPVQTAPGVFRMASRLERGDSIVMHEDGRTFPSKVSSVSVVKNAASAYNLLVSPSGTFIAGNIVVHNKGCFLPDTPVRMADGTAVPISAVRPGDRLLAFASDGTMVTATVRQVLVHDVEEYRVVTTGSMVLSVTPEHPFYVGNGTFKTLETLVPGNSIRAYDGTGLRPQRIESIDAVRAPVRVYNLMTDSPHTFFANGIAVHNKGGGGGCFAGGTPILTPKGEVPIERIRTGDKVIAVDGSQKAVIAVVEETHIRKSPVLVMQTTRGGLTATKEHPIAVASGGFRPAGELAPGDRVLAWRDDGIKTAAFTAVVTGMVRRQGDETVYNLTVDAPHTFVAGGFIVHNKGGGGGGYRSSSGRSSSGGGTSADTGANIIVFFIIVGFTVVVLIVTARQARRKELDQLFSRADIEKKSAKTGKLLQFISRQEEEFDPEVLRKMTEETFRKLQQCWQERAYEPMKPLLMPDLYSDHVSQLKGMERNHEINKIEGLSIDAIDLVNVRYTVKKEEREFTALITATATDYYIDDRTGERLRGDRSPAQFQEFWTFQYYHSTWLLREIEQTAESDILNDDNVFEQFTDKGMEQVAGAAAKKEGPEGPWLEGAVMTKERRVERMLNFLVKTDKIWDRKKMMLMGRSLFLSVTGAWESGDPAAVPADELFPELARDLRDAIARNREKSVKLEFRNLAVRKVELVLVQNFPDNSKDEYVARIRAHAQKIMKVADSVVKQDEDVTAFEEYLTFGRLDGKWKMKEIVLPHEAEGVVEQENVDQEATKQQIEWYYQHKRSI